MEYCTILALGRKWKIRTERDWYPQCLYVATMHFFFVLFDTQSGLLICAQVWYMHIIPYPGHCRTFLLLAHQSLNKCLLYEYLIYHKKYPHYCKSIIIEIHTRTHSAEWRPREKKKCCKKRGIDRGTRGVTASQWCKLAHGGSLAVGGKKAGSLYSRSQVEVGHLT